METTLLTLRSAKDKFSQNHEGKLYFESGSVLRQTGVFNDRKDPDQTEPVIFLSSPHLTLEPFTRRPKNGQRFYAHTLLQSLYRYDAGEERERRQVVQKTYGGTGCNEILHVNQTWFLMIGSNILVTVSKESAERMKAGSLASDRGLKEDGDPITMRLIDEGNRRFNVILDPDASYADLLRHSVLVATGDPSQAHEYYITDLKGELFTPARWIQLMSSAKPEVQTFVLVHRQVPGKVLLPLPAPSIHGHRSRSPSRQRSLSRQTTWQGDESASTFVPPGLRAQSSSLSQQRQVYDDYRSPSPIPIPMSSPHYPESYVDYRAHSLSRVSNPSLRSQIENLRHQEGYFDHRDASLSRVSTEASARQYMGPVIRHKPSAASLKKPQSPYSPYSTYPPYTPTSPVYYPASTDAQGNGLASDHVQSNKRDYELDRSGDAYVITVEPPPEESVTKKPRFALPPRSDISASDAGTVPSHHSGSTDRSSIAWYTDKSARIEEKIEKINIANTTIANRSPISAAPEPVYANGPPRNRSRTTPQRAAYSSLENVAEEEHLPTISTGRRRDESSHKSRVRFGAGEYRPESWSLTLLNPRQSGETDLQHSTPNTLPFFSWRHSNQPHHMGEERMEESLVKIMNRVDSTLKNQLQGDIYGSTFRCSRKDFMQRQRFHLQPPINTEASTPQGTVEAQAAKVKSEQAASKPNGKTGGFFSKAKKRTLRTTFSRDANKASEEPGSPTESHQSKDTERSPQQIPTAMRASTYDHWLMVRFLQVCRKLSSAFLQSNIGNIELHNVSLLYWGSIDCIFRVSSQIHVMYLYMLYMTLADTERSKSNGTECCGIINRRRKASM